MSHITLLAAFVAGMLSFFSPCVFPLIPAYVSHLTGAWVKDNRVSMYKTVVFTRSIGFIFGFSLVFVGMGASASLIGQLFASERVLIEKLSGLLIIVFGLQMANIIDFKFLNKTKQWSKGEKGIQGKGLFRSVMLGIAFATGWTPCVGLALSSILLLAGSQQTLASGTLLLFIYALGLGIPFLIISIIITYSLQVVRKINKLLPVLSIVSGWVLVALGLLLFTGQLQKISSYLANYHLF